MSRPRRAGREAAPAGGDASASSIRRASSGSSSANYPNFGKCAKQGAPGSGPDKMGGLPLPDVVRELLREKHVLRWDFKDGVYEVLDGDEFERRFNELRKVRNKVKAAGTERPFSRMYNFYVLETGDKWAKTGTRFRPRCAAGQPTAEILSFVRSMDSLKSSPSSSPRASSITKPIAAPSSFVVAPAPASAAADTERPSQPPRRVTSRTTPAVKSIYQEEADAVAAAASPGSRSLQQDIAPAHVRHPPAAPRQKPAMPPLSILGKRHASSLDEEAMPTTPSLSDQIYRAFRNAGVSTSPRGSYPFDSPRQADYARGHKILLMAQHGQHGSERDIYAEHSSSAAYSPHHDVESQQAPDMRSYDKFDSMSYHSEPIEIDDASSGFPSPETLFGLVGEFTGSPLDLGDPELPLFGIEDAGVIREGTALKDHCLMGYDAEWEVLHCAI